MPLLVAAPDKFRGTATAMAVAGAIARSARAEGWSADEIPLADGGEGTLEVLVMAAGKGSRAEMRQARVAGPLGLPVTAAWCLLGNTSQMALPPPLVPGDDPTAVVEAAQAAGRALLPHPSGDDAVEASTRGVGELVVHAVAAGARQIIVAVGGSATTDGGAGARAVIGGPERLAGVRTVVAYDVTTRFEDAATVFGPQKGATPGQVAALTGRLVGLAEDYERVDGVLVRSLSGAGAAGGLAGGLAALGAVLAPGFALVAAVAQLDQRLRGASLVVTGEGRLDTTSTAGKVVGGVLAAAGERMPALCIAGQVDPAVTGAWSTRPAPLTVVSLADRFGLARATGDTIGAVADVVADHLGTPPSGN